jgi:hypothetical protein
MNQHKIIIVDRMAEKGTELATVALKWIEQKSELTEEQHHILTLVYEKAKDAMDVWKDEQLETTIHITKLLAILVKIVETVEINHTIRGSDKKAVVLALGKLFIEDRMKDESLKQKIRVAYDLGAEQMLEIMIDVSRVVNTKKTLSYLSSVIAACCG